MVSWFPGSGSLVPEFLGSLVPWFPGPLVSWFPGSLVPWFPVLCRISLAETMKNETECWCFFDLVFFAWGVQSLTIFVEFLWFLVTFCGHFGVILRSRGALGSKMTPRGIRVEKGQKREGCSYPSALRIVPPFSGNFFSKSEKYCFVTLFLRVFSTIVF